MTALRKRTAFSSPSNHPTSGTWTVAGVLVLSVAVMPGCARTSPPRPSSMPFAAVSASSAPSRAEPGPNIDGEDSTPQRLPPEIERSPPSDRPEAFSTEIPPVGVPPYQVAFGSRTVTRDGSVLVELRLRAVGLPPPLIRLTARTGTGARIVRATLTGPDGVPRTPRLPFTPAPAVSIAFDEIPIGDITIALVSAGDPGRYSVDLDTSGH